MLVAALSDADSLYWEAEVQEQAPPKWKKIKVNNESVTDSISTVKMAISLVRTHLPPTKTQSQVKTATSTTAAMDAKTVDSQMFTITHLTKQVSILQLTHDKINSNSTN